MMISGKEKNIYLNKEASRILLPLNEYNLSNDFKLNQKFRIAFHLIILAGLLNKIKINYKN